MGHLSCALKSGLNSDSLGIPLARPDLGAADQEIGTKPFELRVVGSAERWDMSGDEPSMTSTSRFSMVKLDVDRTKLVPTIKPFSREAHPDEIRREQEVLRKKDMDEANDMRKLLDDVRKLKSEGVEDWMERMRPDESMLYDEEDGGMDGSSSTEEGRRLQ